MNPLIASLVYLVSLVISWAFMRYHLKRLHEDANFFDVVITVCPVVNSITPIALGVVSLALYLSKVEITANKFFRL